MVQKTEEKSAAILLQEASALVEEARQLLSQTRSLCQEAVVHIPEGLEPTTNYSATEPPSWCVELLQGINDWQDLLQLTRSLNEQAQVVGSAEIAHDDSEPQTHSGERYHAPVICPTTTNLFVEADELQQPPLQLTSPGQSSSSRHTSSNSTLANIRERAQRLAVGQKRVAPALSLPRLNFKGLGRSSWLTGGKTQGETYTAAA